jgi:hypothetical protein
LQVAGLGEKKEALKRRVAVLSVIPTGDFQKTRGNAMSRIQHFAEAAIAWQSPAKINIYQAICS